jgi:tartrate dehydrogenase/decarboxylase/D-malate dehydrogenase
MSYRIALIPGDGIGKEVVPEGRRVLERAGELTGTRFSFEEFPWGSEYYLECGRMMPADALERLRPFDAIYLGAVGDPRVPDHVTLNGLLLPIRRAFDQYACVRPAVFYEGTRSPLAGKRPGQIDFVVVRENTEGEYAQVGGHVYEGGPQEVAVQTAVFTRHGTERVIRFAFELARKRGGKRKLTSVTKSNAQGYGMVFWDRVFKEVSRDYPDVATESLLVDAACMDLVRRPEAFDVMVGSNLFGDILTDLAAAVTGSLGLAPSANLNPARTAPSMFEPVHGSAPDIAGRGLANPLAQILSGRMMLEFLGQQRAAELVENAVRTVLREGRVLTRDLGGSASTGEVTDAVLAHMP